MDKKKISLFTDPAEELIAPAWKVFGFDSLEKFETVCDMIVRDIAFILMREHKYFRAGHIKEIAKLDYPRELVLWIYGKVAEAQAKGIKILIL